MSNHSHALLLKQAEGLLSAETDWLSNAANLTSLLYFNLTEVNWVGFYFLQDEELRLGPFHGQAACTRIGIGQGVCGSAFANNQTLLVDDVHQFAGHIACDAQSQSEIVVPFTLTHTHGAGVLDVDSPILQRFSQDDKRFFESIVQLYVQSVKST